MIVELVRAEFNQEGRVIQEKIGEGGYKYY